MTRSKSTELRAEPTEARLELAEARAEPTEARAEPEMTRVGPAAARSEPAVDIAPCRGASEYPRLVEVWRSAVDATHDFLAPEDRDQIERGLASDYFPAVELLVARREGEVLGFAGVSGDTLEMLFVDAAHHGRGVGGSLLRWVVERRGVRSLDVNEQNPGARGFYEAHGFSVVGRDSLDEAGRPYPLLHMRLG